MQIVTSTTPSGILTRTANVPGRTYGAITFGSGTRDEPIGQRGIGHLALHLIEAGVEPALVPSSAWIDENALTFFVSGTTAQVLAHFRAIADAVTALGSVTAFELDRAKHLLDLEEPGDYRHPGVNGLTLRYGLAEIGRSGFGNPSFHAFTKKDVARWAASHLVAENAAVSLTKPLTASFDLDLPAGVRPTRGVAVPLLDTPTLLAFENRGVSASLVVPAAGSEVLAKAIRLGLRERLVDQAGLVYSIDSDRARVDDSTAVLSFTIEPPLEDVSETVRVIVQALRDVAAEGVSAAALSLAIEGIRLDMASDPKSVRNSLEAQNALALRDFADPGRDQRLASALALTPEAIGEKVSEALSTLIVAFEYDADVKAMGKVAKALDLGIDPFRLFQEAPEKLWKKALKAEAAAVFEAKSKEVEGLSITVADGALLQRDEDGLVEAIDFDDLVLVGERPDGTLVLVDGAGRWLPFEAADWKQGARFIKALRKALPSELRRDFPSL